MIVVAIEIRAKSYESPFVFLKVASQAELVTTHRKID